jgi:hypothetical protein
MNETLKGSAILEKIKSKRVRCDWLQRFMADCGFTTEDVRPLEECIEKSGKRPKTCYNTTS